MPDSPRFDPTVPLRYDVVRSRRRTLALHILPGGRLEVRAPMRLPLRDIGPFVESKRSWVERTLRRVEGTANRTFLWGDGPLRDGEIVLLRGLPHVVRLVPQTGRRSAPCRVERDEGESAGRLLVPIREGSGEARAKVLALYKADLDVRLDALLPACVQRVGRGPSALGYRLARSRWGSCGRAGRISLNVLCAALPDPLLEYVLCHELCHLLHLNHGRAFWISLERVLPDWAARRKALREWHLQAPI